jgi:hypothetical protein
MPFYKDEKHFETLYSFIKKCLNPTTNLSLSNIEAS